MSILFFLAVLAITAILFGGWVVGTVFRTAWQLIHRAPGNGNSSVDRACRNPGCRTLNPIHARFCRRCGANLGWNSKVENRPEKNIGDAKPFSDGPEGRAFRVTGAQEHGPLGHR